MMSEADPAPDLEDVRAGLISVKGNLRRERDRKEINLVTSALDVALEVDGPTREYVLQDARYHVEAVLERSRTPTATAGLRRIRGDLEEVIES